jgi:hypothetical protein
VFLFSPLLLLYIPALKNLWQKSGQRRLAAWSLALVAMQLLFYAKWWDWSGDDAWGPRFLVASTMACLAVVGASELAVSNWFPLLTLAGLLVELPPVLLGPNTSLMLDHVRNPMKTDPETKARSPITLDDIRFDPRYSQVTSTVELLMFKLSNGHLAASSAFISSFDPPLGPSDILVDIFWLDPFPHRQAPRDTVAGSP